MVLGNLMNKRGDVFKALLKTRRFYEMTHVWRQFVSLTSLVCVCASLAFAQADVEMIELDNGALQADNGKGIDQPELTVRLQNDGLLAGRLQVFYPTGKSQPAEASVRFSQNGTLAGTAATDAEGRFQLTGLNPGEYLAQATVGNDTTDFNVNVLAFDPSADASEMVLEGTLTPIPQGEMIVDGGMVGDVGCSSCGGEVISEPIMDAGYVDTGCATCSGAEVIGEPIYDDGYVIDEGYVDTSYVDPGYVDQGYVADMGCGGCSTGFSGGGCCGGGGGAVGGLRLGGLLGVAGLATGITALALDDDNEVSPTGP
jgi:hypothetical protein